MTLNRRQLLGQLAGASALGFSTRRAAAFHRAEAARPGARWGGSIGEVSDSGAIFWSKSDRPARLSLRWSTTPSFREVTRVEGALALPKHDYCAKLPLTNLPPGQRIFYEAVFESLTEPGARSLPIRGELSTPGQSGPLLPLRFAWSGDTFGQGYGINPQWGGLKIYDSIRKHAPHCFIHCGDRIYADQTLRSMKGAGQNRRWYNLVPPELEKVAESVPEFWGRYRYPLLDEHQRRFHALVPQLYLWDDHEVKNDWWPGKIIEDSRYRERRCDILAARSRRAWFDYTPVSPRLQRRPSGALYRQITLGPLLDIFLLDSRSGRGPNPVEQQDPPEGSAYLGEEQLRWLIDRLQRSEALWQVIVTPQPLAVMIGSRGDRLEGWADGFAQPRGRERELVRVLKALHERRRNNVVWVSADVHYAAAYHFHPDRAAFGPFNPFWEFTAGPLNAATLPARRLDRSFGPREIFKSVPDDMQGGRSPLDGLQFYGIGEINQQDKSLRISLHKLDGEEIFARQLEAKLS